MKKTRLFAGLLVLALLAGLLPTGAMASQARSVDLTGLSNLAPAAMITHSKTLSEMYTNPDATGTLTDGDYSTLYNWVGTTIQEAVNSTGVTPWVNLSFGENRSIGGFEIAFEEKPSEGSFRYNYRILAKAAGVADYTELFTGSATKATGDNIKTHALANLAEYSDIKVELTKESSEAWPILAEFKILGEKASAGDGLIEVAARSEITVPSNEDGAGRLVDGNTGTMWAANSGTWPANVDFALPGNLLIKRIEVDFEHYADRTFNLQLGYAVNNVTSDYSMLSVVNGHSANETYQYEFTNPPRMTHVRISLLGTNGLAWPAMTEVRIYAVDEQINLDDYDDITTHATVSDKNGGREWNFGSNQQVAGFRAVLADGASAKVLGRTKQGTDWTTYVNTLTSGDNVLTFPAGMSIVRVETADLSKLTGFQIFGTYTAPVVDSGSVAFDKPTHGNFDAATSYLVNDGDASTAWQPEMYPAYVDIDMEANYNISEIQITTPSAGYSQYSVYTSMDGRDFDLVGEKMDEEPCAANGDKFTLSAPKEARIVRVYLEYYSESDRPSLNEVRVIGTPSGSAVRTAPEVNVGKFADSKYAAAITNADVIAEVQGIVRRQVGADYVDWFTFAVQPQSNGYDYFTLSDEGGKIKVTGNNGVSLATGVNHYLKYYCNVHISQVGSQLNMPAAVVPVGAAVHKETRFPVRYAYNYCTHSYSMAFWGEDEWRNELDWLALNGVNVVLDVTGQEEVWRQFLMKVGYTHQEAKDFLAGPGYYAWAYMANLTGFGGPVHDSWLTERTELGRKNQRIMRTLGMEPVLQAFSGMVPVDIATHDPEAADGIILQGKWCSFQRPAMLKTDTAVYDRYAKLFYQAQKDVFGDAKYYATDPFHEGGNTGGMSPAVISSALLDSLLEFDSDAVWVIQSWQGNPSNGLLDGLRQGTDRRDHALILDLWAEHSPHNNEYGADTDGDGIKEFSDTPWVWCMLNNFGGRMGLHGHLDALQKDIPAAANGRQHMAGIGISPEGSQENPVLYDFLFETIWTQDADQDLEELDLEQWLRNYALRRYGAESESAEEALSIMAETVYKSSLNMAGQGSPESVVNARPALSIGAASTWGNSSIGYSKPKLEQAAQLLLADYDTLSASDAYLYDVADVLKQVLSNSAQSIHASMAAAYSSGNAEEFAVQAEKFLNLIDLEEQVLSTRSEFLFGSWTTNASELAANADDFTQRLYLRNAKALVTTWGSIQQCNAGGLKDYSNRQWAGLTRDYYKVRWTKWIDACKANLASGVTAAPSFNWFAWEWSFARDSKPYSNQPDTTLSLKTLGNQILTQFSVQDPLGERDLDPATMTVKAGTQELESEYTPATNVLDRDGSTIWHSQYSGSTPSASQMWLAFDLGEVKAVDGLRYMPRQSGGVNGTITGYKVYVSQKETDWNGTTDTWTEAASGSWTNDRAWKTTSFDAVNARYVKLMVVSGVGGFASAAEVRITQANTVPVTGVSLNQTTARLYTNQEPRTVQLTATVTPGNASNKAVTWSSSNAAVASVDQNGLVTAVADGEAVITVTTAEGGKTASCNVSVSTQTAPPQEYTITYDLAGGTLAQPNPTRYTEETESFTLNNPTREGYRFTGWTGTGLAQATVTVTITKGSTGNRSYTATWEEENEEPTPPAPPTPSKPVQPADPKDPVETTENGNTVVTVTNPDTGSTTVTVSAPDGSKSVIVNQDGGTTAEVTISQEAVDNAGTGVVTVPVSGLTVENQPELTITLPDGVDSARISVPAAGASVWTVAVLVSPDGTQTIIPQSLTENGAVQFPMSGSGTVILKDHVKTFRDVGTSDWFGESVAYVASRELFLGTSEDTFSPKKTMSRAMLVTVLYRYAGQPEHSGTAFADVRNGSYYSDAVSWAAEHGIVTGTGQDRFAPDAPVSREQLAVMLYRFAGSPNADQQKLAGFADGGQVSAWAARAMAWAVDCGIIRGTSGGRLAPSAQATRAEVAAMLLRFTRANLAD